MINKVFKSFDGIERLIAKLFVGIERFNWILVIE